MTTFKQICLDRHEAKAKLDALRQCRTTLADCNLSTTDVDTLIAAKTHEIDALKLNIDERKACLDKYQRTFARRYCLDLPSEIRRLKSNISCGQSSVTRKRAALIEADIDEATAISMFPDFDATEILQSIAPLEAEKAAWAKFAETGLESDLPVNISELYDLVQWCLTGVNPNDRTTEV